MVKYKTIPIEALKELIIYNPENGEPLEGTTHPVTIIRHKENKHEVS